jgi:ADP-ribose pyrophosphatase
MGGDAVMIVPRTTRNTYILTAQKRVGSDTPVYEFPSGGIKEGESPEEAAKRELQEETGATGTFEFITKVEPLSGLVKFSLYIFVAQVDGIVESDKAPEEHEDISTVELTKEQLVQKMKSLEKVDGYLALGLGALELL